MVQTTEKVFAMGNQESGYEGEDWSARVGEDESFFESLTWKKTFELICLMLVLALLIFAPDLFFFPGK